MKTDTSSPSSAALIAGQDAFLVSYNLIWGFGAVLKHDNNSLQVQHPSCAAGGQGVQESSSPGPHEADILNDGDKKHKAAQRILIKDTNDWCLPSGEQESALR